MTYLSFVFFCSRKLRPQIYWFDVLVAHVCVDDLRFGIVYLLVATSGDNFQLLFEFLKTLKDIFLVKLGTFDDCFLEENVLCMLKLHAFDHNL